VEGGINWMRQKGWKHLTLNLLDMIKILRPQY
jgi:hypothetical protein